MDRVCIESKKIAFCMTVPSALRAFMAEHIKVLSEHYRVTVFCNFTGDGCEGLFDPSVELVHIPFERPISPLKDFKTLFQLRAQLKAGGFASIHSIMPKTGLLSMVAGWMAGVPVRIHTFTGQVWATKTGAFRLLLKTMDRMIGLFSTGVYADSPSQLAFLKSERVIKRGTVLADGSITGVDCNRFKPDAEASREMRSDHGVPSEALVFGFVGRLNRDKGVCDLIEAFSRLEADGDCRLLLVGSDEEGLAEWAGERFPQVLDRIVFAGYSKTPERCFAAFDIYCLPSYREGFGSSVIEAGACGIPTVCSRIYGLTDAVVENETGIFHEAGDVGGLLLAMQRYASDPALREQHGNAARARAVDRFPTERLTAAMQDEYRRLLGEGGA